MAIFSRRNKRQPDADGDDLLPRDGTAGPGDSSPGTADGATDDPAAERPGGTAYHRSSGPFDRSEVAGSQGRLDLGSLWVTGVPGMELRLEIEQETQALVGVTAVLGESALQLQAFAAPRTDGIWDDIRTEIAASITSQGGTAEEADGPLGRELQARMPGKGADGRTVYSPARFMGVDGPRWFLRGVLSGRAAVDPDAAAALMEIFKGTVVVRGQDAMAPRDLLPLTLPEEAADPAAVPEGPPASDADAETVREDGAQEDNGRKRNVSTDDLKPFERGPEITEVR